MDNPPPIPRRIAAYIAEVAEATGVEPTARPVGHSKWLVELRTDRVYATCMWRHNRLNGRVEFAANSTLEVDGKRRKVPGFNELGDVVRYPDGKPVDLPPMATEFDPERLPKFVRDVYEPLREKFAEHPQIVLRVGRGRFHREIDLAIDMSADTGLRMAFRNGKKGWHTVKRHLLIIIGGVDRSHEIENGDAGAAVELLMTANTTPPVPKAVGEASAVQTRATSVQVRNTVVMRN